MNAPSGSPADGEPAADQLLWARDELLRELSIDSPSGSEGPMIDHLERVAATIGAPSARVPTPGGADNLVLGDHRDPLLAIVAHVDTIVPTWHPRRPHAAGGVVHGLGAVDDKGGVVACLLALRLARARGIDLRAMRAAIAFSVDEEQEGTGSAALARELGAPCAIALEGTGLRPALAEAGGCEAWLEVRGRLGHGALTARADRDGNAIMRLCRLVSALEELDLGDGEHPLLGRPSIHALQIAGGSDLNATPERARVHVNAYLGPDLSGEQAFERLRALAADHGAEVEPIEHYDAFETPAGAPIARLLARESARVIGAEPEPIGMRAWTDAHSFAELAGAQAIVFGPGDAAATAHRPDERIDVAEIVACAEIFAGMLAPEGLAGLEP